MKVLAIDTALAAASACVFDAFQGVVLAQETLWQARGHDETLLPLIDRVAGAAGVAIDKIAVTVGPGSFTGLRIGVSAARALGVAWDKPVVGVSTLSAYCAPVMLAFPEAAAVAAIDARHGRAFVSALLRGRTILSPRVATPREAVRAVGEGPLKIAGPMAAALAIEAWSLGLEAEVVSDAQAPDIVFVARLGAAADPADAPPRPLYINPPETTPQPQPAP